MSKKPIEMQSILRKEQEERHTFWRSLDKKSWIAAARSLSNSGELERCLVCGMTAEISQNHHIVPLGDQYDRGFLEPSQRSVALCPNHHVMIHKFMASRDFRVMGLASLEQIYRLTEAQTAKLAELIAEARKKYPHIARRNSGGDFGV